MKSWDSHVVALGACRGDVGWPLASRSGSQGKRLGAQQLCDTAEFLKLHSAVPASAQVPFNAPAFPGAELVRLIGYDDILDIPTIPHRTPTPYRRTFFRPIDRYRAAKVRSLMLARAYFWDSSDCCGFFRVCRNRIHRHIPILSLNIIDRGNVIGQIDTYATRCHIEHGF
jgi:hypothetical protein